MLHRFLNLLGSQILEAKADTALFSAVGTGLIPVSEKLLDLEMRSEFVEIDVYRSQAVIQAEFELVNLGPQVVTEVGFPLINPLSLDWVGPAELRDFEVYLHSTNRPPRESRFEAANRVAAIEERTHENETFPLWAVWSQDFKDSETVYVYVRYRTEMISYTLNSPMPLTYVLRTGKFWRGLIGLAIVKLTCHEFELDSVLHVSPEPTNWDNEQRTLLWQWTDLDPDEDICVAFSPGRVTARKIVQQILNEPSLLKSMDFNLGEIPIIDPFELLTETPLLTRSHWPDQSHNRWPENFKAERVLIFGRPERSYSDQFSDQIEVLSSERRCDYNLLLSDSIQEFGSHSAHETEIYIHAETTETIEVKAQCLNLGMHPDFAVILGHFVNVNDSDHYDNTKQQSSRCNHNKYFAAEKIVKVKLYLKRPEKIMVDHPWLTEDKNWPYEANGQRRRFFEKRSFPFDKTYQRQERPKTNPVQSSNESRVQATTRTETWLSRLKRAIFG